MYEYYATVVKVVDGDTVHLNIDLGLNINHFIKCRLARINSPELSTPEGKLAKGYLQDILTGEKIIVRTVKDKTEKYGRYLVEIETAYRGNINDHMVSYGMAKFYDGKTKVN